MTVFFIETPLQLLNAIEARYTLSLYQNHLVVVLSDIYPAPFFDPLLNGCRWDSVHYVDSRSPRSRLLPRLQGHGSQRIRNYRATFALRDFRKRLDSIAADFRFADSLFIGNHYLNHMRHFSNVLQHGRLILLDDGTATLEIAEDRRRQRAGLGRRLRPSRTETLTNKYIGWRLGNTEPVTFFTTYDLQVPPSDTVIRHEYQHFRRKVTELPYANEVLFLGQTIYYEGMTDEGYLRQLRRVQRHFASRQIVYAPHKGEAPGRVDRIREEFGWEIRRFDAPVEYHLAMRGPLPRLLASFYSSALENCRLIFGPRLEIESVYLEPDLVPRAADFVASVYDYYESKESEHFRVVRL